MKLSRIAMLLVTANLVACASAQRAEVVPAPAPAVAQAPAHPYALPPQTVRTVTPAPAWFVQLPPSTDEMIFAAATASSTDEQMAYVKARMFAEQKLVEQMRSVVRSQIKSYRNDTGDAMIESFESVVRKNAQGELIGAQRVDSQVLFDGRVYKVYVLLRLPLGDANKLARENEARKLKKEADARAERAHRDLDANSRAEESAQEPKTEEKPLQPLSQVTPVTVPATETIKLMNVDNEDYKRRRDETLQKPGAVIGQTVVR